MNIDYKGANYAIVWQTKQLAIYTDLKVAG